MSMRSFTVADAMNESIYHYENPLGLAYERVSVTVPDGAAAVRDGRGRILPTQEAPAMQADGPGAAIRRLAIVDLSPNEALSLAACADPAAGQDLLRVERQGEWIAILNGDRRLRIPATGLCDPPFPEPIESRGHGSVHGVLRRGRVETTVESLGPCFAQWRTEYRWGTRNRWLLRVRWVAGSDTLIVEETIDGSDLGAVWDYHPLGMPAQAWACGGGGRNSPMLSLAWKPTPGARRGRGQRLLGALGHISSFNQWCLAWVGFTPAVEAGPDDLFVGIFSGWGGSWRRRGWMRPEVIEEDGAGHFLRFPLRPGRRLYGLVVSTRAAAGVAATDRPCLLNARKRMHADLPPYKVAAWELDPPLEPRRLRLVDPAALEAAHDRLAHDPEIGAALRLAANRAVGHPLQGGAIAWFLRDGARLCAHAAQVAADLRGWLQSVATGGYEGLCIFHGRNAKTLAYEIDLLWAEDAVDEGIYRELRRILLAFAYMFADPDYCNYGDYWPHREPDEGIVEALVDEMGDCPVPPNFGSEFFTTTGLMAEFCPGHPQAAAWRAWACGLQEKFLETFFEPDGTYHESINYQSHGVGEMVAWFWPLARHGGRDWFQHPAIKGTYRHYVDLLTPPLAEGRRLAPDAGPPPNPHEHHEIRAAVGLDRRAVWPPDGNSGKEGQGQEVRDDLPVAAAAYAQSDPALAGALMHAWRLAGKPLLQPSHPLLTLLTLDPRLSSVAAPWVSTWRHSLGIVSKTRDADGEPLYCLFRAGRATHHMDFDQGNLFLAYRDRVLLGDHGYHTHDTDGTSLPAPSTWLHNTVTYQADRELSSGYTGLEQAPEPLHVTLANDFDWVAHRIVNTNYRNLRTLAYHAQIPAPTTTHLRHYLFCKRFPAIVLWDVFETLDGPATLWLHAPRPFEPGGPGHYRSGSPLEPHLEILFPAGQRLREFERRPVGPLFCLGMRLAEGFEALTILLPTCSDAPIHAEWEINQRTVRLRRGQTETTIRLPVAGSLGDPEAGGSRFPAFPCLA